MPLPDQVKHQFTRQQMANPFAHHTVTKISTGTPNRRIKIMPICSPLKKFSFFNPPLSKSIFTEMDVYRGGKDTATSTSDHGPRRTWNDQLMNLSKTTQNYRHWSDFISSWSWDANTFGIHIASMYCIIPTWDMCWFQQETPPHQPRIMGRRHSTLDHVLPHHWFFR